MCSPPQDASGIVPKARPPRIFNIHGGRFSAHTNTFARRLALETASRHPGYPIDARNVQIPPRQLRGDAQVAGSPNTSTATGSQSGQVLASSRCRVASSAVREPWVSLARNRVCRPQDVFLRWRPRDDEHVPRSHVLPLVRDRRADILRARHTVGLPDNDSTRNGCPRPCHSRFVAACGAWRPRASTRQRPLCLHACPLLHRLRRCTSGPGLLRGEALDAHFPFLKLCEMSTSTTPSAHDSRACPCECGLDQNAGQWGKYSPLPPLKAGGVRSHIFNERGVV
ncbi:uncharacterized protein TRAVEDRAFT_73774 [Trametes versicolor FP-101664 SS1]|uniref:uncharacterized protein n=1 Tax=Trametes versicolor (strain FP-101664) TaxID=717944 RepID=UPI0004622492|nr:uncharacterized protein TRAVEDRAFT_73774 [Trametes versicolor FP-101664 SS1]EIW56172.1 hypothetical protein TRAVEDRAFT_73774 [Trametes versicolor FP-101664 SS1]